MQHYLLILIGILYRYFKCLFGYQLHNQQIYIRSQLDIQLQYLPYQAGFFTVLCLLKLSCLLSLLFTDHVIHLYSPLDQYILVFYMYPFTVVLTNSVHACIACQLLSVFLACLAIVCIPYFSGLIRFYILHLLIAALDLQYVNPSSNYLACSNLLCHLRLSSLPYILQSNNSNRIYSGNIVTIKQH